jgi:hypothetical protein
MATLGKLEILSLFKTKMLQFIDNLVELFPNESDLVVYRLLFESQIPIEHSLSTFRNRVLEPTVKDMITNENEKFFLEDNKVFNGANEQKVIKWKQMWTSHTLDSDDKKQIWKWLKFFLGLAEKYNDCEKKLKSM